MFGFKAKRELKAINEALDRMRPEKIMVHRGMNTIERVLSTISLLEFKVKDTERELLMLRQKYEPTRERVQVAGARSMVHGGYGVPAAPKPWYQTMDGPPTSWPNEHGIDPVAGD